MVERKIPIKKKTFSNVVPSYHKPMHSTIAPELIDPNLIYSLTINPSCQLDNTSHSSYLQRAEHICCQWAKHLDNIKPESFRYLIYPETKNGRIHFHGVIQIRQPLVFDVFVLPFWKNICTYEIDTIEDVDIWLSYMSKQNALWHAEFPASQIKCLARQRKELSKVMTAMKEATTGCQGGDTAA